MEDKGILITATTDITVQGMNAVTQSIDGFLAAPIDEDSTEFYAMSYSLNTENPQSSASLVTIVAARDNTAVEIWRRKPDGSYVMEVNVMMQRYNTYSLRSDVRDYTGTHIRASRPVSVFSGHECAEIPTSTPGCNYVSVNVPPVSHLGEHFAVAPIGGRDLDIFALGLSSNKILQQGTSLIFQ